MPTHKFILCLACLYFINSTSIAQDALQFSPFVGKALFIPLLELEKGHGPHVYDNRVIRDIVLDSLNIPRTDDSDQLFPGMEQKASFGLVLNSTVTAVASGCYAIELETDDGSKLWIDKKLVLNNDRPHKMRKMSDTIFITAGEHLVKLWYYNAYPTEYGLILNNKFVAPNGCENKLQLTESVPLSAKTITLQSEFLFDFDQEKLKPEAITQLNDLCLALSSQSFTKLTLIGYTDSKGQADYNLQLSARRAHAVKAYIATKIDLTKVDVKIIGAGESEPVASNETSTGRQENRRVVITYQ